MAEFNRKALKEIFEGASLEVPKDVIGQLCDLHTSSQDTLTEELKELKTQLTKAEQERDDYKAKVPEGGKDVVAKEKFDGLKKEFDEYKKGIEAEAAKTAKEKYLRNVLTEAKVDEKVHDLIVKGFDLNRIEFDEKGTAKNAEALKKQIGEDYGKFAVEQTVVGAKTPTPPVNNPTTKDPFEQGFDGD